MDNSAKYWLVGTCSSDGDAVYIKRFWGTKDEAKQFLYWLIKQDKKENEDDWDFGTDSADEVTEEKDSLYAFGCYCNWHIDYQAWEENEILSNVISIKDIKED